MNDTAVAVSPETVTIHPPGPELLLAPRQWVDIAKSYAIMFPEARVAASEDLARCKQLKRDLDTKRRGITAPLDEAKARVMDMFREPLALLDVAIDSISGACIKWDVEEERKRREAAAAAARIADEQRRKLEDDARKAKAAGNAETAHVLASAAAVVAPAPVAAAPKLAGESYREQWGVEEDTIDLVALARAVADGLIAPANILPNVPVLNQQARALKGAFNVPGVKAVSKRVIANRAPA